MSGLLTGMGPRGTALALLVLGHVLADFALQRDWMVDNKHRPGPLLAHGALVLVAHAFALIPMLTLHTGLLVLLIAVSHVIVDRLKASLREPEEASLGLFLADQGVHLLVILLVWARFPAEAWTSSPVVSALGGVTFQIWSLLTTGAVYVSALVFVHHGGNAIVQGVLPDHRPAAGEPTGLRGAGRTIGTLERLLVLLLALAGQWEALALGVAAKSIARFEELKERSFAEYFLVGTLASVLVAVALALLVGTLV